jgi:PD-(D/E)XK nuclease superfamily protein
MRNRGMGIKHPKLRGEWVELRFMMRAIELALHLNKPWGEVMSYDFVVENYGRFVRVQVKSTMFKDRGGYSCTVRGSNGPYQGDPFDYLAAYVIQEDLWYIIPAELVVGQGSIALYPRLKGAKYEPYKEAWHLLVGERPEPGKLDRIEACAEEPALERVRFGELVLRVLWGGA